MKKLVPVEENSTYMRDLETKAIINTDVRALEMYRAQKTRYREMDKLKEDVCCLKNDIGELKQMLVEVLKNKQ